MPFEQTLAASSSGRQNIVKTGVLAITVDRDEHSKSLSFSSHFIEEQAGSKDAKACTTGCLSM
jgi:hypothetical protein